MRIVPEMNFKVVIVLVGEMLHQNEFLGLSFRQSLFPIGIPSEEGTEDWIIESICLPDVDYGESTALGG
ncbi:hypothetical protein KKA08_07330 [bacterium]|nr:hypothetical protein [bacterium]